MAGGSSRIPGFYRLDVRARRERLAARGGLDATALAALDTGGLDVEAADGMIENVVGTYALPLAVAPNFLVDGTDYVVPMAIEEPSVVAAAANAARMVRAGGGFVTRVSNPIMLGQVQVVDVPDPDAAARRIDAEANAILDRVRALAPRMVARGGGPVGLAARVLSRPGDPDGGVVVVHVRVDCRDAMGANAVNGIAEGIADDVARIAGGRVGLRILSNLADERLARVSARVPDDALGGAAVRSAIAAASRFAEMDPYRAATHNKGIMNGVDAVLVATAQDWRGVEAGAHAYAARTGRYAPLATWRDDGDALVGTLELPMPVGTVGGAVQAHPGAQLALRILGVRGARELAAVAAAAGLASNLAALRALATDGIQRGHMSLHARVVARAAGAGGDLVDRVAAELAASGEVKVDRARAIVRRLRKTDARATLPGEDLPEERP
ncbi:MAG: hydroxymethylglutaryl-CoA reductase, degradative [Deltaproteobacteria bacterium]|nr:MAG: hydroxymethylglutaryl-CoA reductase, degradative [Deltaproteobacteria bacterium]